MTKFRKEIKVTFITKGPNPYSFNSKRYIIYKSKNKSLKQFKIALRRSEIVLGYSFQYRVMTLIITKNKCTLLSIFPEGTQNL